MIYLSLGLYPAIGMGSATELRRLSLGTTTVAGLAVGATFLGQSGSDWSRQILLVTWGLSLFAVPMMRASVRRILCRASWWGIPVAVLGAGATGVQVITLLRSRPWMGLRPVMVLDDASEKHGTAVLDVPITGALTSADQLQVKGITHAILAIPSMSAGDCARLLDRLGDLPIDGLARQPVGHRLAKRALRHAAP